MSAPGIGIVLRPDRSENAIYHRYLPFDKPVSMDELKSRFQPIDVANFDLRRFSTFWIFEVQRASFVSAISGFGLLWP